MTPAAVLAGVALASLGVSLLLGAVLGRLGHDVRALIEEEAWANVSASRGRS